MAEVGSEICEQGAREQVEENGCCGKNADDSSMADETAAGAVAKIGPGVGNGCGTVDITQQFDSTEVSLLAITGCVTITPLSRTSQTFAGCNVFGVAADTGEATSAA